MASRAGREIAMAKLATTLSKLDDVPEALREFYEPVDANDSAAGFQLSTDDSADKSRRNEFRTHNIELRQKMEGMEGRLGKLDGVESRLAGLDKLLKAAKTAEDKKAIEDGDIDSVVERRVTEVVAAGESKFSALESVHREMTTERDGLRQRVGRASVRDALMSALDESKVRIKPGAVDDVLRRTHDTWSMERKDDGKDHLVAKRGGEALYGEGGQPMAMKEYVGKLATEAHYFFESGTGGGAVGNRGKRVVDTRGKRGVDFTDPMAIGRNLDALLEGKAVLTNTE